MINAVTVAPSTGVQGTQFSLTCQAIDLGAGVAFVSANIHAGDTSVGIISLPNQGGDTFGATINSTDLPFGIFTIDITATDTSAHANSRTLTNATGFEVIFGGLFGDGFDLANTSRWSRVVGEGPPPNQDEITIILPGGVPMDLVYVPPGSFDMGSPTTERGRDPADEDLHQVTLTEGYYLGKYEVTQAQWEALTGSAIPSACGNHGTGPDYPAYCISWNDICGGTTGSDCVADSFIGLLNTHLGTNVFRLPTEAEWERGARADTQTRFSHGDVLECDDDYEPCQAHLLHMWWGGDDDPPGAKPVGEKQPNDFGLYDTHGNLYEFVADRYHAHLGSTPVTDPTGPETGSDRVRHSGYWHSNARYCRPATRIPISPTSKSQYDGFRIARTK